MNTKKDEARRKKRKKLSQSSFARTGKTNMSSMVMVTPSMNVSTACRITMAASLSSRLTRPS